MNITKFKYSFFIFFFIFIFTDIANSQFNEENTWYYKDFNSDSIHGISLQKTYNYIQKNNLLPSPIIIAILDNGIDTTHIYIKNNLWKNTKEIPNNNIDDDKNGYVDDINGWNFLGNAQGNNLDKTSDERSRIYWKYYQKYHFIDTQLISLVNDSMYNLWKSTVPNTTHLEELENEVNFLKINVDILQKIFDAIQAEMDSNVFTIEMIELLKPQSRFVQENKMRLLRLANILQLDKTQTNLEIIKDFEAYFEKKNNELINATTPVKDYRKDVLNDDYYNWNNIYYGNNNVMVNSPFHGTHVGGICLSKPLPDWDCNAFYPPIKLMIIRVVPNGDEYDKDIALGIKYAVDNGANIINMSFGKSFSPEQFLVNNAIKYAGSKNVLLIHSAGNDKKDLNTYFSYPTPYSTLSDSVGLPYFITVGASSDSMLFDSIQSNFTNFGKNKVDIMAPGVKIYSSIPFKDNYGANSGTSMAGPVVTHVAALLWSYFPQLKAYQIKDILLKSASIPLQHEFSKSCTTGGIVNAFNAFQIANQIFKNKKK